MSDENRQRAVVEAAIQVGRHRGGVLDRLRAALLRNDVDAAIQYARQLTGLEGEDESDRTPSGIH